MFGSDEANKLAWRMGDQPDIMFLCPKCWKRAYAYEAYEVCSFSDIDNNFLTQ
jgi:hypothetical protein